LPHLASPRLAAARHAHLPPHPPRRLNQPASAFPAQSVVHKIKGDTAASSASAAQPIAQGGATLTLTSFTREGGGVIPASSVALRQGATTLTTGTGDAATVAGVVLFRNPAVVAAVVTAFVSGGAAKGRK
jgi:hypothetical protein